MPEEKTTEKTQQEDQLLYEKYLKTTSKQAGMVFGTRVIGYLLGFAMQAVFARFLGPDKYGVYSLGLTIANVGVLFGVFGLPDGMTRFLSEYIGKKDFEKAKGTVIAGFKWSILFSLLSVIVIFLFRKPIAMIVFKEERLISLIPWFLLILILLVLINILKGVFYGLKNPSLFNFYKEIVEKALRAAIFIVLFLFGMKLMGVVIATVFSSAIILFPLMFSLFKKGNHFLSKKIHAYQKPKVLLSYSSNMLFVSFTSFLMGQVNRLIIGGFLETNQVGLYTVADMVAHLSVFFLMAFNSIFASIISEVFHKKKMEMLQNLYSNITRWITALTIPIVIWIVIFSEDILSIFGTEYTIAKFVLIILAVAQFINSITGGCEKILIMTKYQSYEMINGIIIAGTNIGLNFLLIPRYGIIGSAVASAIAISSVNITRVIEVFVLTKLFPYSRKFLKLLFPASVTFFTLIILNVFFDGIHIVFISFFCSFLVFLGIFILTNLYPEDKLIIKMVLNKLRKR